MTTVSPLATEANAETGFLTVAEIAAHLRVSEPTVYRRIADGTLAAVRLGAAGPIRVPVAALRQFLVLAQAPLEGLPASAPVRTGLSPAVEAGSAHGGENA